MTQQAFRFVVLEAEGMLILRVNESNNLEPASAVFPSCFKAIVDVAGSSSGLPGDPPGVQVRLMSRPLSANCGTHNQSQTDDLG